MLTVVMLASVVALGRGLVAVDTKQLAARLARPIETPYVYGDTPILGVERHIRTAMLQRCGVPLIALPPGSGKSTAARVVANELLAAGKFSGVAYLAADSSACVSELVARHLKVTDPYEAIDRVTDNHAPLLVVVDDADCLAATPHDVQLRCQGDLVCLAGNSLATKRYMAVMLFRTLEAAQQVDAWNGGHKIRLHRPYDATAVLPTHEELDAAVARQSVDADIAPWFAALARVSRSIGFVARTGEALRSLPPHARAAYLDAATPRAEAAGRAADAWVAHIHDRPAVTTPLDRQIALLRDAPPP